MHHSLIPYGVGIQAQHLAMRLYPEPAFLGVSQQGVVQLKSKDLAQAAAEVKRIGLEGLVIVRPDAIVCPVEADMKAQNDAQIPFGIIAGTPDTMQPPFFWGDQAGVAPLLGRPFIHGIWDCYSLVRDAFQLGAEQMRAQNISQAWALPSVSLPDVPRSDGWWEDGKDLYMDWMKPAGFVEIDAEQARPGDGFLMKLRSTKLNHAGVLVSDNEILHHLPTRLSRRETGGVWFYQIEKWVRYQG